MLHYVQNFHHTLLDLLFPPRCLCCRKWDTWLCEECFQQLQPQYVKQCLYCGRSLVGKKQFGLLCTFCLQQHNFCQIFSFSTFTGLLKELIHTYKYERIEIIQEALVTVAEELLNILFTTATQQQLCEMLVFVPVPLYQDRFSQRGFNQAYQIAAGIALKHGWVCQELLQKIKATSPQMELDREARWQNVATCFSWDQQYAFQTFSNKLIIVVDDVATTGATIQSCWFTLQKQGLKNVIGLVLAHGG